MLRFESFVIETYKAVTHLPCLDVKLKHELLLPQAFLIIAHLGLFTDDWWWWWWWW